jgi:hypothetical protein
MSPASPAPSLSLLLPTLPPLLYLLYLLSSIVIRYNNINVNADSSPTTSASACTLVAPPHLYNDVDQ